MIIWMTMWPSSQRYEKPSLSWEVYGIPPVQSYLKKLTLYPAKMLTNGKEALLTGLWQMLITTIPKCNRKPWNPVGNVPAAAPGQNRHYTWNFRSSCIASPLHFSKSPSEQSIVISAYFSYNGTLWLYISRRLWPATRTIPRVLILLSLL